MNSHVVLLADYVTTDSGTGVVHLAPAFGEEDMDVATANGIEVVRPLDEGGRFTAEVPPYEGQMVFDANPAIIKDLKAAGRVLRHETIEHSYPHSWRSGQPLIYMAVPSWFVAVTKIRDRMVELNQEINWTPEHIRDGQFGKWLEGARDWNISRNRYWGAPIPVWVSDDPAHPRIDVYGSLDELERDFGVRPDNLHRPHIDELTRPNPDDPTGKSTMRRVPEVLDCWFESGSMPYAQVHYPFENREWFDGGNDEIAHNPGDFIVEYNGQTRGWFYNLHVLSTALFDRPAFRNVSAHGIVLGNDGQKMSKSKRNYPDVNEVFDRDGSDAMRWFLMASPILRGGNLVVTEQGIREGVRQALLPLWNAYSFLQLYAERPATWRTDSDNLLDRYILAKLAATRDEITQALETYDISGACDSFREFCESLTNWFVRRSRARFWAGQDEEPAAFDTLYTVLEVASRLAAPLLPLATEAIWRGLTGGRSVHLTDWPSADELPHDEELVAAMDEVRAVCSVTSSVRKANKLRVRLPLPQLTIAAPTAARLAPYTDLVADEMNVKSVVLRDDPSEFGRNEVVVNARAAGPRLGRDVQELAGPHGCRRPGGRRCRWHRAGRRRVRPQTRRDRAGFDRRASRRRRPGGARHHGHPGAGSRGLGQGPRPRAAGGPPRPGSGHLRPHRRAAGGAGRPRGYRAHAFRVDRRRGASRRIRGGPRRRRGCRRTGRRRDRGHPQGLAAGGRQHDRRRRNRDQRPVGAASGHGRLLRVGGAADPPDAARPTGARRWPGRSGSGGRCELRGPRFRCSLGDAHAPGASAGRRRCGSRTAAGCGVSSGEPAGLRRRAGGDPDHRDAVL
jgi:isoleucyl-tRNA synthetase